MLAQCEALAAVEWVGLEEGAFRLSTVIANDVLATGTAYLALSDPDLQLLPEGHRAPIHY